MTPPSELIRPPSKAAVIFLRSTAGKQNGRRLSLVMAGMACLDPGKGLASATESYARSKAYATSATPNPPPSRIRWASPAAAAVGSRTNDDSAFLPSARLAAERHPRSFGLEEFVPDAGTLRLRTSVC